MKKILIFTLLSFIVFLVIIYIFPINLKKNNNLMCTQAFVRACHVITGECRLFPNPCRVPHFWEIKI